MTNFKIHKFPKTRVATIDVCEIGMKKHHIAAMLEFDVTEARDKIRSYKRNVGKISFTAWIIKVISFTVKRHESAAAYLKGKRRIVIFEDINISMIVEKESAGQKVPIPLIIEKANERSIESITNQITDAKSEVLSQRDIVLQSKTSKLESLYYYLPGFIRRFVWKSMLRHPSFIYSKMGNVAITSIGMMGSINGWFIPKSIHPICFGICSIVKKPAVVNDKIEIREMLNMSILIDHDVIDGAPMARFIRELSSNIEKGLFL